MLKELKDRWVAALRSGKYNQATGILRAADYSNNECTPVGYCCLGVLCDIIDPDGWDISREDEYGDTTEQKHRLANEDAEELSYEGLKEVGMAKRDQLTLIAMNDGAITKDTDGSEMIVIADYKDNKQTFEQIATWIETNL